MSATPTTKELEEAAGQSIRHVHWTLQRKGGIGKSFVAKILTEYLNAEAYDLDSLNQTLASSQGHLNVKLTNVTVSLGEFDEGTADSGATAGALSSQRMDMLVEHIIGQVEAKHSVIDCGSPIYEPILDYIMATDLFTLFAEHNIQAWLHLIVCGGPHQATTASDVVLLLNKCCPKGAKAVIWENDYQGNIVSDDPDELEEKQGVQNIMAWPAMRQHTRALVSMRRRSGLEAADIQSLIMRPHRSFAAAINDSQTSLPARSRLKRIWDEYERSLDLIFAPKVRHRALLKGDAVQRVAEQRRRLSSNEEEEEDTMPDFNGDHTEELHEPPDMDEPSEADEFTENEINEIRQAGLGQELSEEDERVIMGGDDDDDDMDGHEDFSEDHDEEDED